MNRGQENDKINDLKLLIMKATELRIGNLVKINNELLPETKNEIYKVYGLNAKFDLSFPDSSGVISLNDTKSIRIYSQFDEFIKPIPLTEEWLLRLGFESTNTYYFSKCNLHLQGDIRGFHLVISRIDGIKVKYVHQLQNLYFALTGEELTI